MKRGQIKRATKLSTAYQIECYFEPLDEVTDGRTLFRNKWIRYEHGRHVPQAKLVELVEAKCPGTAVDLYHPLWKTLKLDCYVPKEVESLFGLLEPQVKGVVYERPKNGFFSAVRLKFKATQIPYLLKIGNMDALAALLLYWQEATSNGNHSDACFIAKKIYSILLNLGWSFLQRDLDGEIFRLFKDKVFEKTDWEYGLFAVDEEMYCRSHLIIEQMLDTGPQIKPYDSWRSRSFTVYKMLDRKCGLYLHFGFGVALSPNWSFGPPTPTQYNLWLDHWKSWLWGWVHVNQGTRGFYARDKVWHYINEKYPRACKIDS